MRESRFSLLPASPAEPGSALACRRASLRVLIAGECEGWEQAAGLAAALKDCGHAPVLALVGPEIPEACAQAAQDSAIHLSHVRAPRIEDAGYIDAEAAGHALAGIARDVCPDMVHALTSEFAGFLSGWPLTTEAGPGPLTWWPSIFGAEAPAAFHWRRQLTYRGLGVSDAVTAPTQAHADAVFSRLPGLGDPAIVPNGHVPLAPGTKEDFAIAAGACWADPGAGGALIEAAGSSNWPVLAIGPTRLPQRPRRAAAHLTWIGDASPRVRRDYARRALIALALDRYAPSAMGPAEAASTGAALILADIPSNQELWRGCGLFVDPDEPAEIAFAINELAESEALRTSLSAAARKRAALFTHEARAKAMLRVYATVLSERERIRA